MSKEQTPIESLIIDLKIMARIPDNYTLPMIIKMIEQEYLPKEQQYAQAKVLEALEREFLLANEEAEFYQLDEYYETEVKPKYK